MNTNKRGKKRSDVVSSVAETWNKNLKKLIEDHGYSQKTFAQAFKKRYGTGNQADVSRWVRVGEYSEEGKIIGIPSYDTMKRIADFFGVHVGYLTGETDYKTFDMERACKYLGIEENAGDAIERITKLKGRRQLERYMKENYGKALNCLLSALCFEEFLGGICEYAEAVYLQRNPVNFFQSEEITSIRPDILERAILYRKGHFDGEITDEVMGAIDRLSDAESRGFEQEMRLDKDVKVAGYELQERYLKLLAEIVTEENIAKIRAHSYETIPSVADWKKRLDAVAPE